MLRFRTTRFARSTTWTVSLALHAGLALAGGRALSRFSAVESLPIPVELDWGTPPALVPDAHATEPSNVLAHVSAHTDPHVVAADARPRDPTLVHARAAPPAHTPASEAIQPSDVSSSPGASLDETPARQESPPLFVLTAIGVRAKTEATTAVETGAVADQRGAVGRRGTADVGASPGAASDGAERVFAESAVDVPARLLAPSTVEYPAEARATGVEADVPVEIVLDERGTVASARSLGSAGYGFDEAALRAVRHLRFTPALRAGRAVRVRMRWPVVFRLR
jgi:TonB family protein